MTNNQQPGWPQQPNNQQPPPEGTPHPPIPPAPVFGPDGQPQQFPPHTQQPGQQPYTQQPGQPPYAQQEWPQQGQPPYGNEGGQYGPGSSFMQAPPKKGMPVWGWVAGGAGVVAVLAVAGVMAFNGLAGSNQADPVPDLKATESAAPEESAASEDLADSEATRSTSVYTFDDAGFTSAPVWSIKEPQGWTKEQVSEGTVNYRNASLQCTFTTYQATLEPTGETDDEASTKRILASEIEGVKTSLGKPVELVDDTRSLYVKLRDDGREIEMQQAELRFKNDSDADVVYRLAVRTTTSSNGLMELALACPAGMDYDYGLWLELAERVTMVEAP